MDMRFLSLTVGLRAWHFPKIFNDAVCYAPSNEVELSNCRRVTVEVYPGRSTERIEQLLRVAVKTRLVGHVDREHLSVRGGVRDVLCLGKVRNEPFEPAERWNVTGPPKNIIQLLPVRLDLVKALQTREENV
jgi:hypothetical protein